MNDLELLRPTFVFCLVVEQGSFKAAAMQLNLSAPYISQLISDLETRLGKQLLFRSTRKLALTDEGQAFFLHAQTMKSAFSQGIHHIRNQQNQLNGTLRVSVPSVFATRFFGRMLHEFQSQHPLLQLDIDFNDRKIDPVETRTDLSIRITNKLDDSRLARRLFTTRGIICAAPNFPQLSSVKELEHYLWLRPPALPQQFELIHTDQHTLNIHPSHQMTINSAITIRTMLLEGACFGLFPEFTVRESLAKGELINPFPDWSTGVYEVNALFTEHRTALTNAKAFVEFILAFLAQAK